MRKTRIILMVSIIIIILGLSLLGVYLYAKWPATWSKNPPILDFPLESIENLHIIGGYGYTSWGWFHPGIDFGVNASVNIIAPCDLRVIGFKTWMYATEPERWQTNVLFNYNWQYSFDIVFESWANNETFGIIQREAIIVKLNQIIPKGTVIGRLLYHGEGTHIHFMIKKNGEAICPYLFFSPAAKTLFDSLWIKYGTSTTICNETII